MAKYGWIIDKDLISDGADQGVTGPRSITPERIKALNSGEGEKFRMYDDDGVLYYEGRYIGDDDLFAPLEDFGTPNAGCTEIRYWRHEGKFWEAL